ncbi:unnamed protein product [Cyprideis torosa]|uniref:Uncharacterized protein n=1 Tax=Cyprideis torosa TaxID=163714 RepID=A0A7R8ZKV9_9CRUS|nr:unnamed protein product [Cyprideis torosa]CAG0892001.1 unnamed protein product [Cyprideis torosa]
MTASSRGRMLFCNSRVYFPVLLFAMIQVTSSQKANFKVHCGDDVMRIEVSGLSPFPKSPEQKIFLDKYDILPPCQPKKVGKVLVFELLYKGKCGVNRVDRPDTGDTLYYHRLVTEGKTGKHVSLVKCILGSGNSRRRKRQAEVDELPDGFLEPDVVEIVRNFTGQAPVPVLNVAIRQDGELINEHRSVKPGSPLTMEVFLDPISAPIYGLEVKQMEVTDARSKQEVLLLNSCSLDTHLFEDFNTVDGDFLQARFRAFKFPETTYVEFKGTVDVCLDRCPGVICSNRLIGYGKRRRRRSAGEHDALFRVAVSTVIRVDEGLQLQKGILSSAYAPAHLKKTEQTIQVPRVISERSADPMPIPEEEPSHEHAHVKQDFNIFVEKPDSKDLKLSDGVDNRPTSQAKLRWFYVAAETSSGRKVRGRTLLGSKREAELTWGRNEIIDSSASLGLCMDYCGTSNR